jgi:hypothetical protein
MCICLQGQQAGLQLTWVAAAEPSAMLRSSGPPAPRSAAAAAHLRRLPVDHPAVGAVVGQNAGVPPFHIWDGSLGLFVGACRRLGAGTQRHQVCVPRRRRLCVGTPPLGQLLGGAVAVLGLRAGSERSAGCGCATGRGAVWWGQGLARGLMPADDAAPLLRSLGLRSLVLPLQQPGGRLPRP